MLKTETIDRLTSNARRLSKDALHLAVALDIMAPIDGRQWTPICCGCLDAIEPAIADELVRRVSMRTEQCAGPCVRCSYVGCDTLVAALVQS